MIRGYSQVKTAFRHYTSEDSVQKRNKKSDYSILPRAGHSGI